MAKTSFMKTPMKFVPSLKTKSSPFLGFNLYAPAVIAFVGYIILALTILLPFEYPVYDEASDTVYIVKYDLGQRILMLLLMTIPIALSIYTINCMMSGQCVAWSYIISIITVLWVGIFVITAVMYTFGNKAKKSPEHYTASPSSFKTYAAPPAAAPIQNIQNIQNIPRQSIYRD